MQRPVSKEDHAGRSSADPLQSGGNPDLKTSMRTGMPPPHRPSVIRARMVRGAVAIHLAIGLTLAIGPALAAPDVRAAIAARAACITHEGGDLPPPGSAAAPGPPPPQDEACATAKLDGTVCAPLDGAAERGCLAGEIALWDGVLDRLVPVAATTERRSAVKRAIAAFRTFRDTTCAAYDALAINPSGPAAIAACRVGETARFAQRLYLAVYSP